MRLFMHQGLEFQKVEIRGIDHFLQVFGPLVHSITQKIYETFQVIDLFNGENCDGRTLF